MTQSVDRKEKSLLDTKNRIYHQLELIEQETKKAEGSWSMDIFSEVWNSGCYIKDAVKEIERLITKINELNEGN